MSVYSGAGLAGETLSGTVLNEPIELIDSAQQSIPVEDGVGAEETEHVPLFVAAVKGCDMKCWYCTEHGEGRSLERGRLSDEATMEAIQAGYESGIRSFRFTGGEPTLRPGLGSLMEATQNLGPDVRIAITTNGSDLESLLPTLERLESPSVFLSVDSYDDITDQTAAQNLKIEKWLSPKLRDLIDQMPENVQTRINYVLTATNRDQLPKLIDFAVEKGIDLKIFELLLRDYFYAQGQTMHEAFADQYVSVREMLPEMAAKYGVTSSYAGTGGKGIPMSSFTIGESKIVFFDSAGGSHYGDACNDCVFFPCQEGFYAMTLDANGVVHPSGCSNIGTYVNIAQASQAERVDVFSRMGEMIGAATMRTDIPNILASLTKGLPKPD